MVYERDAFLRLEIHPQPVRIQRETEIPTEYYWGTMHDALVDVEKHRLTSLDTILRQKEQVAKAYNKSVNIKLFELGDLAWKVILPMDKKDSP